jgi:hypothetical protein
MIQRYYVVVYRRVYEFDRKDYIDMLEAGASGEDVVQQLRTYGGRISNLPRVSFGGRMTDRRIDPLAWKPRDYDWELRQVDKLL